MTTERNTWGYALVIIGNLFLAGISVAILYLFMLNQSQRPEFYLLVFTYIVGSSIIVLVLAQTVREVSCSYRELRRMVVRMHVDATVEALSGQDGTTVKCLTRCLIEVVESGAVDIKELDSQILRTYTTPSVLGKFRAALYTAVLDRVRTHWGDVSYWTPHQRRIYAAYVTRS